jgi:hypothetical protein
MLRSILLISLFISFTIFKSCSPSIETKEVDFIDSTLNVNSICIDASKPLTISYLPLNDCQTCMYKANDVFNNIFTDKIDVPKSNIIFVTDNIRDKEVEWLFKNIYSFNAKKYNLIKSDTFIPKLLEKFKKHYAGTSIFVLDANKELLYYNQPKKIYNMDSLISIINNE